MKTNNCFIPANQWIKQRCEEIPPLLHLSNFFGGTNLYTYPSICFSLQFCWWWRNGVEQFQKLIFFPSCHNIIILCKYSAISIVYILPLRIHGLKNIHRIFLWATSRTWCDIPLHHISISSHSYMRAIVAYLVFRNLCRWRW